MTRDSQDEQKLEKKNIIYINRTTSYQRDRDKDGDRERRYRDRDRDTR